MTRLFRFNLWLIRAVRNVWRWYCGNLIKGGGRGVLEVYRDDGLVPGCVLLLIWLAAVIIGFPIALLVSFVFLLVLPIGALTVNVWKDYNSFLERFFILLFWIAGATGALILTLLVLSAFDGSFFVKSIIFLSSSIAVLIGDCLIISLLYSIALLVKRAVWLMMPSRRHQRLVSFTDRF